MLIRNWEGKMVEAPSDLPTILIDCFDRYLVLSRDSSETTDDYQVRYGLQVTRFDTIQEAISDLESCLLHAVQSGIDCSGRCKRTVETPELLHAAREMLKCTGSHTNWQGETGRCLKLLEDAVAKCEAEQKGPSEVERLRQCIRTARFYVKDYKSDGESATHAKRMLENAIYAFDGVTFDGKEPPEIKLPEGQPSFREYPIEERPFEVCAKDGETLGEFETVRDAIEFGNAEVGVEWYVVDRISCNHWEAEKTELGWVISDQRTKIIILNCDGEPEPETPLREKTLLDFISEECGGWRDGKHVLGINLQVDAPWLLCPVESNCGRDMVDVWKKTIQMIDLHLETGIRPQLTEEVRTAAVRAAIENCRVLYHG